MMGFVLVVDDNESIRESLCDIREVENRGGAPGSGGAVERRILAPAP